MPTQEMGSDEVPRIDVTYYESDHRTPHRTADDRHGLSRTDAIVATIHLAFAFDIGDEIDLDRARLILQGEPGQLPRRRRTPESIGYRPAPIRVELEPTGIELPGKWSFNRPPRGELTLFDFGAISLAVQFPVNIDPRRTPGARGSPGRDGPVDRSGPAASVAVARAHQAVGLRLRH